MSLLRTEIDGSQIRQMIAELEGTEKQVELALRSTNARMRQWLKSNIAKEVKKAANVPAAAMKKRMYVSPRTHKEKKSVVLWLGLDPMSARSLRAKQTKSNVVVPIKGKPTYKAAFQTPKRSQQGSSTNNQFFRRLGRKAYPIEVIKIDIDQYIDSSLLERVLRAGEKQFYKVFEHNLKWQISKSNT